MKKITGDLDFRVTDLEGQIELIKSMGKSEDGSAGLFELIEKLKVQIRAELQEKTDSLLERIEELETLTRKTDDR